MVNSDGVKPAIHDADPSIFGREDEERHQRPAQIVKIVFLVEPQIARVGKALSLVHHVPHVGTVTVVELTFEKLQRSRRRAGGMEKFIRMEKCKQCTVTEEEWTLGKGGTQGKEKCLA